MVSQAPNPLGATRTHAAPPPSHVNRDKPEAPAAAQPARQTANPAVDRPPSQSRSGPTAVSGSTAGSTSPGDAAGTSRSATPEQSPASPKPSEPTAEELFIEKAKRWRLEAAFIENVLVPAQVRGIITGGEEGLSVEGVRWYLMEGSGGVEDPIEKMLVRQLIVGHHQLLRLYESANGTSNLEAIKIYNAAAARLQSELRRVALSIRTYRSPVSPKQFTIVEQQNVAQQQEVSFVQQSDGNRIQNCRDTKLTSNGANASHVDHEQKLEAGAGRMREPQEAR